MSAEIVLVEFLDSRGRAQFRERIVLDETRRTFVIGRSVSADVTLDDEHAAVLHARVEITPEGRILVSDLGALNGIIVAGKRHHGGRGLELPDNILQVGRTRLRVRTTQQSLAPEKPDQFAPASLLHNPAWLAAAGAAAVGAELAYSSWLGAPRDLAVSMVTIIGTAALVVGVWVAVWALLSRVMLGEWRWLRHAAISLGIAAVVVAVDGVLDIGWFMLSLPRWGTREGWLLAIAVGGALYLHLINASSLTVRRAAQIACLVPALLGGAGYWLIERDNTLNVNRIDADLQIYPPGMRLRAAGSVGDYFKNAAALRGAADKKRQAVQAYEADQESE